MADINTSDIRNSRDALSDNPVTAALGGACAGHVVAHVFVLACGTACLPFILAGAAIFGLAASDKK
jgi:hypothetical protein